MSRKETDFSQNDSRGKINLFSLVIMDDFLASLLGLTCGVGIRLNLTRGRLFMLLLDDRLYFVNGHGTLVVRHL